MVSKHQIRFESILVGVGSLMIECLIDGTYATIQNSLKARTLRRPPLKERGHRRWMILKARRPLVTRTSYQAKSSAQTRIHSSRRLLLVSRSALIHLD